jgi:maltooligosyltrehalose trehalohydrolase
MFNWPNYPANPKQPSEPLKFVLRNLDLWVKYYGVDGFRLDMTNHISNQEGIPRDDILRIITNHLSSLNPQLYIAFEDGRSERYITLPTHGNVKDDGLGAWAKWNFDFHHHTQGNGNPNDRIYGVVESDMDSPEAISKGWRTARLKHYAEFLTSEKSFPLSDSVTYFDGHDEIGNGHGGMRASQYMPRNHYIVGSMMKYLLPSAGILNFQGEEYFERNPFHFFADQKDPAVVAGTKNGRQGYPPEPNNQKYFKASQLSWTKNPQITRLTRDMIALRRTIPALWEGSEQQMSMDTQYVNSGVLTLHRLGANHPNSQIFAVINFSNTRYPKEIQNPANYYVDFPDGQWKEILNTDDKIYGGTGATNPSGTYYGEGYDKRPIRLGPWSIALFQKV